MRSHVGYSGPFRATRLWDEAVGLFIEGMPLKKHRSHMRHFENCFTGAEAVKWFYSALELNPHFSSLITQEKTVQLLNKFFEEGVFVKVKSSTSGGMDRFKLNGIYQMGEHMPSYTVRTPLATKSIHNQNEEIWICKKLQNGANANYSFPQKPRNGFALSSDYENIPSNYLKHDSKKDRVGLTKYSVNRQVLNQGLSNTNAIIAIEHPLQQRKLFEQQQKLMQQHKTPPRPPRMLAPNCIDEIWKDVFLGRLQKLITDADVSGLLCNGAVIRTGWLEQNCCAEGDSDSAAKFPSWVKAASRRLFKALLNKDLNRSIHNSDIEEDVSAVEAFFGSLPAPLIPPELSVVYQRIFLHLEANVTAGIPHNTLDSKSVTSSVESGSWVQHNESLRRILPPNTCFETAFTSESPVTRIVPQRVTDTLHLSSFSPLKRNVSAPKLLETCSNEFSDSRDLSRPASRITVSGLEKKSTTESCCLESKRKLNPYSFGGSLQRSKYLKMSASPDGISSRNKEVVKNYHHCGYLTVTDKTPPIIQRQSRLPPINRKNLLVSQKEEKKHTRSQSGGYINLALQDSFEGPHINSEDLDLEAAMETLQQLMKYSQPKDDKKTSPRKGDSSGLHMRSSSLSHVLDNSSRVEPDPELHRTQSLRFQDVSCASLSSYHTAVSSSTSSLESNAKLRSDSPISFSAGCEWGWDWGLENEQTAVDIYRLLTLLLAPQSRAQLQMLLKLMGFLPYQCPYTAVKVLEMFSSCIMRGENEDVNVRLVGFLVRHCKEIFVTPQDFVADMKKRRREKVQNEEKAAVTFCEQVSLLQFEEQKLTTSQRALAELLDQILADCKMPAKEKQKKLRMFKDSYPHIYALRFPNGEIGNVPSKSRSKSILQLARLRNLRI